MEFLNAYNCPSISTLFIHRIRDLFYSISDLLCFVIFSFSENSWCVPTLYKSLVCAHAHPPHIEWTYGICNSIRSKSFGNSNTRKGVKKIKKTGSFHFSFVIIYWFSKQFPTNGKIVEVPKCIGADTPKRLPFYRQISKSKF